MNATCIQATVNPRLLTKAGRLFTGTLSGRIAEILQNARRAGATEVHITNEEGFVVVHDNGRGVDDFQRLLDLGSSGWDPSLEESEDPAGVGLFCLAPRDALIRSNGKRVTIAGDGWTGHPVLIHNDANPVAGTLLRFPDEPWTQEDVSAQAVFSTLHVTVDGIACPKLPFVSDSASHHPELGCRIEVRTRNELGEWHSRIITRPSYYSNVLVNFHGQTVALTHHPVSEHELRFLVELTGEPTGIRLLLPARTQLVENEAFEALKVALELEAYRYIQRRGTHTLPFKEYRRAHELGISLPEAKPTYSIGLLHADDMPEPVEVSAPTDFPLSRCYRLIDNDKFDEFAATNAHLLAALGTFEEPFVPVDIRRSYDGYSWAKLETIESADLTVGKVLHADCLWCGKVECVDSLRITVRTSDGRTFASDVCMAVQMPETSNARAESIVYLTPAAEEKLAPSEIWHHLGGWYEDGDTYETQEAAFIECLEAFWAATIGPDEYVRREICRSVDRLQDHWSTVSISSDGTVTVHAKDGSIKVLPPPTTNRS